MEKNGSMSAQNNFQDLHKDTKKIIPKEPTHYFLLLQINYQRIRNQPFFASAQIFGHKKKILTLYYSPSAEI